jgi:hypothetical protein
MKHKQFLPRQKDTETDPLIDPLQVWTENNNAKAMNQNGFSICYRSFHDQVWKMDLHCLKVTNDRKYVIEKI